MTKRAGTELLSPAGSMEALWAAINNGADAVYLGASAFGARSSAGFSAEALKTAVETAHFFGVRVHVTLNTLIKEKEFSDFEAVVRSVHDSGADAVLVQDFGVLGYIKELFPDWPVHASTQMSVHNVSGAETAAAMGCDRVVFARETPLSVIKSAADKGIETEAFVHGALCVSVSGQCAFSAMIGGRSGNRGRCAQPCRLDYTYRGKQGAWLSPRDLNMFNRVDDLAKAGVASIKIEGRLKRPEYVATVTHAYRRALDAALTNAEAQRLSGSLLQIFNRGGFSSGYLFGTEDAGIIHPKHVSHEGIPIGKVLACRPIGDKYLADVRLTMPLNDRDGLEIRGKANHAAIYSGKPALPGDSVGIRLHKPAQKGDILYRLDDEKLLSAARETALPANAPRVQLDAEITLCPDKPARLTLSDGKTTVSSEGAVVQPAQSAPLTEEKIVASISKMGALPFFVKSCVCKTASQVFLPVSALNQLRRTASDAWMKAHLSGYPRPRAARRYEAFSAAPQAAFKFSGLAVQSPDIEHIDMYRAAGARHFFYAPDDYTLPSLSDNLALMTKGDAFVLPNQLRDDTLNVFVKMAADAGVPVVINNVGQMRRFDAAPVIAGPGLYCWNNRALKVLKEQGLSSAVLPRELSLNEISSLDTSILPLLLPVYGRHTMMVLNHCPERVFLGLSGGHADCRLCDRHKGARGQTLVDRRGAAFPLYPVRLPEGCLNMLLEAEPLHLESKAPREYDWLLNFTVESTDSALSIVRYYSTLRSNVCPEPLPLSPYRGRYEKGVE